MRGLRRRHDNHIAEHHSEGWTATQGEFWRGGGIAPDLKLNDVLPRLTEKACTIIKTQAGRKADERQPLLLYLALTAPHTPWLPAAEFAGKSGAGMYGDFVMMVDAQIGRVLAALDDTDMTRDTLLIFTSANGTGFETARGSFHFRLIQVDTGVARLFENARIRRFPLRIGTFPARRFLIV